MGQLAARMRAKFPGAYDDLPDDVLEQKIVSKYPEYRDLADPKNVSGSGTGTADNRDTIDKVMDWVPTAAGMAGGILGGTAGTIFGMGVGAAPGAIGGATVLGAGGEAVRRIVQNIRHGITPDTTGMSELKGIALEGGAQGAYEAGGQVAAKALTKGGQVLYRKLLKPSISERLAERAPEIVDTGLRERVNPFSVKSVGRLEPEIKGINSEVEGIIGGPQPPTMPSDPRVVATRLQKVAAKFAGSGAAPEDRAAVKAVKEGFLKDQTIQVPQQVTNQVPTGFYNPSGQPILKPVTTTTMADQIQPMSGMDLVKARRSTGASAGATSFGITRGAETEARKELYHELGQEIKTQFPRTEPLLNRERQLIDLKDAAIKANDRQANASITSLRHLLPPTAGAAAYYGGGDTSQAIKASLLTAAMTNPRILARLAIEAARAGSHPRVLAQFPRAAGLFTELALRDEARGAGR